MELNFTCINSEISNIIHSRRTYDYYIVLICLVIKDLIKNTKESHELSKNLITYLLRIKDYIDCYVDYDLLVFIYENKKYVTIIDNSELFNINLSGSLSSSGEDLDFKIIKMLKEDAIILNKLYELYNINNNKNLLARYIFNLIDSNNDGLISAQDILAMVCNNELFAHYNDEFKSSIVNLLALNQTNKINFELFFYNFF